jgi:hypothetical protein
MSIPRIFQIKRRLANSLDGGGVAGVPLAEGELAYNEVDDTLYYNGSTGVTAIAGPGVLLTRSTVQTVSGDKTFSGAIDFTASLSAVAATPSVDTGNTTVATTEFVQNVFSYIDGGNFDGEPLVGGVAKYHLPAMDNYDTTPYWFSLSAWEDSYHNPATSMYSAGDDVTISLHVSAGHQDGRIARIYIDDAMWSSHLPNSITLQNGTWLNIRSFNHTVFNVPIIAGTDTNVYIDGNAILNS